MPDRKTPFYITSRLENQNAYVKNNDVKNKLNSYFGGGISLL